MQCHISVYGTKLCASLYWYIMNVREKSKVNEKKRQKHEKNLKSNSLKSLCSHSLSHMCKNILKIILNKYGHLHPSLDLFSLLSSNPISSNPILLPLPNPLPPPAMLSLSSTQKDTCSLDSLICSFMLLDYCCRCCGFTLIKRHGPVSLKTTPSDTWVSKNQPDRVACQKGSSHQQCWHLSFRFQLHC